MEEVQRMGENGDAVAIKREWEMKDEAVKWLTEVKNYIELREKSGSISTSDGDEEYVLLVQVQKDFESVRKACEEGKEEVVVTRSLFEHEEEGADPAMLRELLDSLSYLECPTTAESDDLRFYYRAAECRLSLPASATNVVVQEAVQGHRSGDHDEGPQVWKPCASFVVDTSKLTEQDARLRITADVGNPAPVRQTPLIRSVVNAFARTDEFHLHLKLNIASLSVGVSKTEFLATDTCLGFYPDRIRLSLEPCCGQDQMSVAIFDHIDQTESPARSTSKSTQDTEIKVQLGWGPAKVSAKWAWGKESGDDDERDHIIEYDTETGGVASVEWKICRWNNGKLYKRDSRPKFLPKIPKLPFKGTAPRLERLPAVSWILPLSMRQQEVSFRVLLCFDMQLISCSTSIASLFVKSPKYKKVTLDQEFTFPIQLPAALHRPDATPSN